jgi:hypothetical protein
MTGRERLDLRSRTFDSIHDGLMKLDKVIATHPQKSMRLKANRTKGVLLAELDRRERMYDAMDAADYTAERNRNAH